MELEESTLSGLVERQYACLATGYDLLELRRMRVLNLVSNGCIEITADW